MSCENNIIIGDTSALRFLLHRDAGDFVERNRTLVNPLLDCATSSSALHAFNFQNPAYGPPPVTLLVPSARLRREANAISCAVCPIDIPPSSFFEIRPGLYMASPELVFLRLATRVSVNRLAEIGMELCARYFIDEKTGELPDRNALLTTPERIAEFLDSAPGVNGSSKARQALKFVLPESKSPMENKMKLQFCHPMRRGGFNLPFTVMNFEVKPRESLQKLTTQETYSIDLADPDTQKGLEFDGREKHLDASKDKQRRIELKALGWDIFPLDAKVLYNPTATIRFAEQVARHMGIRLRYPKSWESKFVELRHDLDLPV